MSGARTHASPHHAGVSYRTARLHVTEPHCRPSKKRRARLRAADALAKASAERPAILAREAPGSAIGR